MKAGILTFHAAHHYGAQLQAYALQQAIGGLGAEAEIVDYVRPDTVEAKALFRKLRSARDLLANLHTLLHHGALKLRAERFEQFVREQMRCSSRRYHDYPSLLADPPVADVFVCGSDQIWNPQIYREQDFDSAFFAAFAPKTRRISYAPSFGLPSLPLAHHAALRALLQDFSALSVREQHGETILAEVCGRDAVTVLDPTLLLDAAQWRAIARPPQMAGPYLLCYFISDPAPYAATVRDIARRLGLPIVSLCGARRTVPGTRQRVLDAGPREFLGLFSQAAHVLTDSFHGTVFSINFGRPFHTFAFAESGKARVSSRLQSILSILGLTDRMLTSASARPALSHLQSAAAPGQEASATMQEQGTPTTSQELEGLADSQAREMLAAERARSLAWLAGALAGGSEDAGGGRHGT